MNMDMDNLANNVDLDISWIAKEEQLYSAELNFQKKPMDSIMCYFIYVGSDLSIQKIVKNKEILVGLNKNENREMGIHSDRILQMIQTYRILGNGLKYKILSLSKYIVDLEHDDLYRYLYGDISRNFFKEVSFLEKISIEPCLPIFHSLNSLYFIFKEDTMVKKSVKSILKIERSGPKTTKKVRIFDEEQKDLEIVNEKRENKPKSTQIRKTRKNQ